MSSQPHTSPPLHPRMPDELPPVRLLRNAALVALGATAGRRSPRPLLVYGQGRTGSNLLGSLLACHPQVHFANEALQARARLPERYLDGLRARHRAQHLVVHVKPYHLTDFHGVDAGRWLRRRAEDGWAVVHLQRRDTLRHVLSNIVTNATGVWHCEQAAGPVRVTIDPDELLRWMGVRRALLDAEREHLAGVEHLDVVYEDDLAPGEAVWPRTSARVLARLGLSPCPVTSPLRPTNDRPLHEVLENADEVLAAVAASPFRDLLALPRR